MNKFIKAISILALATSCRGEIVEVPPAHVGKIMGPNGYLEGLQPTSKFRLDFCMNYCDRLITLNTADKSFSETMKLFMPKDKLVMTFDLRMVLAPNPAQFEALFNKIPDEGDGIIETNQVYKTYAQQVIRTKAREILSAYSISEIASSREAVNAELSTKLTEAIAADTPYIVKLVGLAAVEFPEVITKAQENAGKRREEIQREEAELDVSKVKLRRELQEAQMQRKIEVEKANADAEVNRILAKSVTPAYVKYHQLQVLHEMAKGSNKTFVPSSMLDSLAAQNLVGR